MVTKLRHKDKYCCTLVRTRRKLRTDTQQCLFPEPLGSALILFATRSNGTFMSTSLKVITRLGTGVYLPIRSMGAGRHQAEPLYLRIFTLNIWSSLLFFLFFLFFNITFTFQPYSWTSRGHRWSTILPPGACLYFLSRMGFSIPTACQFSSNVADSRSRAFR